MAIYQLAIQLLSDTTFGRGDGVAGLIDQEVEHDRYGFPYLRGRTLKGLLSEECDNLVAMLPEHYDWNPALKRLFGSAGSTLQEHAVWHFGDALLPYDLRTAVATQIQEGGLTPIAVLESLTTIRRQTAIDAATGAPDAGSLRTMRVVVRDIVFTSRLETISRYEHEDLQLLAAGVLALRRLGAGRNRGRGAVRCWLYDNNGIDITKQNFDAFAEVVQPKVKQAEAVQ